MATEKPKSIEELQRELHDLQIAKEKRIERERIQARLCRETAELRRRYRPNL